jgi:TonB-linked SusC/RagA family outer membrane protein
MAKKNQGKDGYVHSSPAQGNNPLSRKTTVSKLLMIMKLTTILLTVFCLGATANSLAQVSISGKNISVQAILDAINTQTDYILVYEKSDLRTTTPVSVNFKNATVDDALRYCLKDQPVTYRVVDKSIFISLKNAVKSLPSLAGDPPVDLHGRLVNAQNEPVVGATITVKGTTIAVVSNEKGEFFLQQVDEKATLIISSVTYETREFKINGKTEFSLQLNIRSTELNQVEVTLSTGYQDLNRERSTGSFVKIDNNLFNRRVSTDVLSRLEGIASGLVFDKGSDNSLGIAVRGRSTIFSNTQPLIVLDNFAYSGDINAINPNDIESVTILKDAAAASIWGAFSGNGVIVITTKKGKYNQPLKIDANLSISVSPKPDLFESKQFLGASDYISTEKFLFDKGFFNSDLANTNSWPVISPAVEIFDKVKKGTITQSQADIQLARLKDADIRNQYKSYLYRPYIGQQAAISLSGGSPKVSYYFSGGFNNDIATVKGNEGKRYNITSSVVFKPIEALEITSRITYAQTSDKANGVKTVTAGGRYSNSIYPYAVLKDDNGNNLAITKDYRSSFVDNPKVNGLLDWHYIPLDDLNYNQFNTKGFDNRILINAKYKVIAGLIAEGTYQYQRSTSESSTLKDPNSYDIRNLINMYSSIQGTTVTKKNIPDGGYFLSSNSNTVTTAVRGQLNYSRDFKKSGVSAIAGAEMNETTLEGSSTGVYGYDPSTGSYSAVNFDTRFTLYPTGASYISNPNTISPKKINRYRSYFANASYTYLGRYTISGSARIDQSNLFGVKTNQKSVPLWSAGIKWDIDKESFFNVGWIEYLKLRATYGLNGNIDKSLTALTIARYNSGGGISNAPYSEIANPGNPQLKWEKSAQLNIGIDFGLLKNQRLSGSLEFYSKKGIDLIGDRILPSSTGFELARGNFSSLKGYGYDLTLNGKLIERTFTWSANLLFSYTSNKITKNEGNTGKVIGRPVSSLFSYYWGGLDNMGDPLGYFEEKPSKDYNSIIQAGSADVKNKEYNGSTTPVYFASLRNTFTYKKVTISTTFSFKAGYYLRRSSINYNLLFTNGIGHQDFINRWQNSGDENRTSVPALRYIDYPQFANRDAFYEGSSALVIKGDHIRWQDVSINYDVLTNSKTFIRSLQVYFYANNLGVVWTANDQKIDPDYSNSLYVNPKVFSLGFRMGL